MKTYEQCCDEVAKRYGYEDWKNLIIRSLWEQIKIYQKEAAQLYARECCKATLDNASQIDFLPDSERIRQEINNKNNIVIL